MDVLDFDEIFLLMGFGEDKRCGTKQIGAYAVKEENDWLVITVIVRFF